MTYKISLCIGSIRVVYNDYRFDCMPNCHQFKDILKKAGFHYDITQNVGQNMNVPAGIL